MGGPTGLYGVAGSQPWPQRHGEATQSVQPSPRRPYLAPSLSQAVCLSVWERLDAACSQAGIRCLPPSYSPWGGGNKRRENPDRAGCFLGLSFPSFLKGVEAR